MDLGEKFRVQGGGSAGDRARREIDALFSRPVWRLEVIRRRAPERQLNGGRQPRTLVGSTAGGYGPDFDVETGFGRLSPLPPVRGPRNVVRGWRPAHP